MKKILKIVLHLLAQMAIVAALLIGFQVVTDGMWLFGLPELEEIQSVCIASTEVAGEAKETTDPEEMEPALKLTGFLKYDLFQTADGGQKPLITITCHLQDGTDRTISANRTTVWWTDRVYTIKNPNLSVNLTERLFFLAEVQAGR